MKFSIKYFAISFLLISTLSCSKKSGTVTPDPIIPDTPKPTITIIKPTAAQAFVAGNTIMFQVTFNDNVKLGSYDIAITKVVLGGFIQKNIPTPVAWSYTKGSTNFTSGVKQQEINLDNISIPLLIGTSPVATGDYNFTVSCVDAAGNIAIPITVVFKIN
jgi:hypothetical protein